MEKYTYNGKKLDAQEKQLRMKSKRHHMREAVPAIRATNFEEVNLGYDPERAMLEAQRCLLCTGAPCVSGCPVRIKIPEMLEAVARGDFKGALEVIRRDNALPAVTGRVCPQESQCEGVCTIAKVTKEAVGIGYVERFLADWDRMESMKKGSADTAAQKKETSKYRVAVVGSGPGGLTVAADLARAGVEVHVFEAFHKAGGVLTYGIPAFRLPKEVVDFEIDNLKSMGITFHTNKIIGTLFSIDELIAQKGFNAVYIGIGAGLPKFMSIEGENLNGISSANEYLTRVNLMKSYMFPSYDTPVHTGKKVAVIGGGNVAMDAVRTAKRLGAEKAYLVYRRSREEMPARLEEIKHAEEEGVEFLFLTNPIKYVDNGHGWIKSIECVQMELGEPDASGRRTPKVKTGSEFEIELDMAIVAVGTGANPLLTQATPDLKINKWGYVAVDNEFHTSKRGVFAGGDIVRGAATVILAMGDGRASAKSIMNYLQTGSWPTEIALAQF